MKKFALTLSALTLAAGIGSAATKCDGVAILQAQAALVSTKEGKAADDDLNGRLGTKFNDLKKRQEDIQQLQDKISRGSNTMSDTQKAQLQKDYDTKNKALTRDQQDFQDEVNAETNKAKAGLVDKMKKIIDQYQKEHNFCLILDVSDPQTPVIAFANEVDITPGIIEAYDKAQPGPTSLVPSKPATTPAKAPATTPAKAPATTPAPKSATPATK